MRSCSKYEKSWDRVHKEYDKMLGVNHTHRERFYRELRDIRTVSLCCIKLGGRHTLQLDITSMSFSIHSTVTSKPVHNKYSVSCSKKLSKTIRNSFRFEATFPQAIALLTKTRGLSSRSAVISPVANITCTFISGENTLRNDCKITYHSGMHITEGADWCTVPDYLREALKEFMNLSGVQCRLSEQRFAFVESIRHTPSLEPLKPSRESGGIVQLNKHGVEISQLDKNEDRWRTSSLISVYNSAVLEAYKAHAQSTYEPNTPLAHMKFGQLLLAASPFQVPIDYRGMYPCVDGKDLLTALKEKMLSPKMQKAFWNKRLQIVKSQVQEQPGDTRAQADVICARMQELEKAIEQERLNGDSKQ